MSPAVAQFLESLKELGFAPELHQVDANQNFAVLKNYQIEYGKFTGRRIDLALPIPNDFPRCVGQSIHIKSDPHLLNNSDSIPNVRNIIDSAMGPTWKYWSFRFQVFPENPMKHLFIQIDSVFKRI